MSIVEDNFDALDGLAVAKKMIIRSKAKIEEAHIDYATAAVKVEWLEMMHLYPRDLGEPEWEVFDH